MCKIAEKAAMSVVSPEHVVNAVPTLASEDFSLMMTKVPSFFYWVGSGTPGEAVYAWHQSRFMADDRGVAVASELYAASVFAASRGTEE